MLSEELHSGQAVIIPTEKASKLVPPPPPLPLKPLTLRVRTSISLLYPLQQLIQQLRNLKEATILLELHDPTGEMVKKRCDLEKLLCDYGCSFEWKESEEAETHWNA